MKELIKRLEEASEGSRELDAEVAYAIDFRAPDDEAGLKSWREIVDIYGPKYASRVLDNRQNIWRTLLPHYTTSLDAALTLIPEGWAVEAVSWWPGGGSGEVSLLPCHQDKDGIWWHTATDGPRIETEAATPALALCAAALEALRAQEADDAD